MNNFKKQFIDFNSKYLLQLRARGDDLSDEAHRAIEEIFVERGEGLPAKPKAPIVMINDKAPASGARKFVITAALILLIIFGLATAKTLAHTWFGVLFTVSLVIYFIVNWFRRQTLTAAEKEREDSEKKAQEEGLTEIMVCAANGNLERIRELVEYGGNVNSRSISGTTALMYAARNNHLSLAEFLLAAGADPGLETDKKSTALDIAKKFGHLEIAARLERHIA